MNKHKLDEKLIMQQDWYYQTGELLLTFGNINMHEQSSTSSLTSFTIGVTMCMLGLSVQSKESIDKEIGLNMFIALGCIAQVGYGALQEYITPLYAG